MKRRNDIMKLIILWTILSGMLFAEPAYYCVFESDTLSFQNEPELNKLIDRFTAQLGDRGYAHAELVLDGYIKTDEREYFHYRVDKGEIVRIDTVVFGDYSPREISLLSRYITLPDSGFFNYTQVRAMIDELKTNELLEVKERADIYRNGLRLYTEAKQDIRFDAIASYKQETDRQGIIGDISLELVNLGGLGRLASFYWSRPTLGVNAFDLSYTEPYIFNRPFSISTTFTQRYQDSLYVKRDLELSVIYHINRRSNLSINYQNEQISSSEAGSDSGFVTQNRSGSGVSLSWLSKPGPLTASLDFSSGLYFSTDQRISASELHSLIAFRKADFGLNFHILGAYVNSKDPIALYDKFKLGGAAFLRGAYFEQYITTAYMGWKLEAGYFKRTHLFAFYDGVIMEHDDPVQHHVGLGFSLPSGNSRLTIALGMNLKESIRQAKFHLSWER